MFMGLSVAICAYVGYRVDLAYDSKPWGVTIGLLLGVLAGFRELFRVAVKAMRESDAADADSSGDDGDGPGSALGGDRPTGGGA